MKTEATPEDIYSVSIPALNANECIVPDTLALSFKFNNSNTKSWFLNSLGRLLVDRLSIKVQGVEVYQNTGESILEVYKDLWRSDVDRANRQDFGIAAENVRKLISKDDSADKEAKIPYRSYHVSNVYICTHRAHVPNDGHSHRFFNPKTFINS